MKSDGLILQLGGVLFGIAGYTVAHAQAIYYLFGAASFVIGLFMQIKSNLKKKSQ